MHAEHPKMQQLQTHSGGLGIATVYLLVQLAIHLDKKTMEMRGIPEKGTQGIRKDQVDLDVHKSALST
jgi:hypothetical protein